MPVLQRLHRLAWDHSGAHALRRVSPVWSSPDLGHSAIAHCQVGGISPVQSCSGGLDGARPQRGGNSQAGEVGRGSSGAASRIGGGAATKAEKVTP